jgi:hypothetical protein
MKEVKIIISIKMETIIMKMIAILVINMVKKIVMMLMIIMTLIKEKDDDTQDGMR